MSKTKFKKIDYLDQNELCRKQTWIAEDENFNKFNKLLKFCDNRKQKILIYQLLTNFFYLNQDILNDLLKKISYYIVNKSQFDEKRTQILAMTKDDDADSSQKMLDYLKRPLFTEGWKNINTVNRFRSVVDHYNNGLDQILLIDEFIGSGKALKDRIKLLKRLIKGKYELKCCFLVGMENAIVYFNKKVEIFCSQILSKGISEQYDKKNAKFYKKVMLELEKKLLKKINKKLLSNYSLGFGKAEALFSSQGCNGNTPNNVFPIFWWPKDYKNNNLDTLLIRIEKGLYNE